MHKSGILLINIGSPKSYDTQSVSAYLKTFLMDENIIDLPYPIRWFLVNKIIVPRRAPFSANNYKKIWHSEYGSPLTYNTKRLADALQEIMGKGYSVKIGMRYSEPEIKLSLREFVHEKISSLLVVPLYPQFAQATTGSSIDNVKKYIQELDLDIPISILSPFYDHPAFIHPYTGLIRENIAGRQIDHFIFSFHGLPIKQVRKESGSYPKHCLATATNLAHNLKIKDAQWSLSYQSRLGNRQWLGPSTEDTIKTLAQSGKKNISIICPSFVADCIETLEEIGIGLRELFLKNGGQEFYLVPCLNTHPAWIKHFSDYLISQTNPYSRPQSL